MVMDFFNHLESNVRGYIRSFPAVFKTGSGSQLTDENGRKYIDFFSGAGTLNYGHNFPVFKKKLIEYLESYGVVHGLDMATSAKKELLDTFENMILKPRNMEYKIQFTGPTGTNAVEAALKIARLATGRPNVISFTNGFHGVTMGSVAATGNSHYRSGVGVPLGNTTFMPYEKYLGAEHDSLDYIRKFIENSSSGVDLPAAVIVETVQGEGGVNVASPEWLRGLQEICRDFDILLIVDDIQVGCGRTGSFFSFENMGIEPDLILLSKSIGAYGLPMALVLMKPELDTWEPGQHNGTFRGNNLAFVAATEAIRMFWENDDFTQDLEFKGEALEGDALGLELRYSDAIEEVRGRGLIYGIQFSDPDKAKETAKKAFEHGLLIETCGSKDEVIKILPPLIITKEELKEGLRILEKSISEVFDAEEGSLKENDLECAKR
ncbi:MAG: diaminobutyrate--2-oxoglutarate transaminase, partial [Candidatus Omnitrophica bacterium]|nr:diaminobutyrate--2-oxoglutarate transaminase [Candidatus Omnitrophota bacterium]